MNDAADEPSPSPESPGALDELPSDRTLVIIPTYNERDNLLTIVSSSARLGT